MKPLTEALIKFTCGLLMVGLLIAFLFYPAIIIVRLKDEEDRLTRELPGYAEYKQKVKYRIIPYAIINKKACGEGVEHEKGSIEL